jgi:transposase
MLRMIDKEYIRKKHFLEGWSIHELSRQLKISRQTVRKMLKEGEIPKYNRQIPKPCPVMDSFREVIESILKVDETAPVKQRHTAARIFTRLHDEYGFNGGESTVRRYVRNLKKNKNECFLVLEANPGEQMQIDFGHAEVDIGGKRVTSHLFCMRLKNSGVPFVVAYPTERLEAFLEGHVQGFAYFGGTPKEGLYDNATTQVVKILEGSEREEHQWFSSLRAHYLFNSLFCRPAKGNEKGSVETLVKYVRSRALVPVPPFQTWEEYNAYLLSWCDREKEKHVTEWLIEQSALRPLPDVAFSTARPKPVKVNSYALVTVDRNLYSVPSGYASQMLLAKAYVNRVDILHGNQVVASHTRCYGRGQVFLEIQHYLTAIERKPHAVTHASVVRQLPAVFGRLRERMVQAHSTGYKDFLAVLLLLREYSVNELKAVLETMEPADVTALALRQRLSPITLETTAVQEAVTTLDDVSRYDKLMKEAI